MVKRQIGAFRSSTSIWFKFYYHLSDNYKVVHIYLDLFIFIVPYYKWSPWRLECELQWRPLVKVSWMFSFRSCIKYFDIKHVKQKKFTWAGNILICIYLWINAYRILTLILFCICYISTIDISGWSIFFLFEYSFRLIFLF